MKFWRWSKRRLYQVANSIFVNSYYFTFLKCFTFPVFNCYSCPLAVVACPIGTMQFFFTTGNFSFLTLGIIGVTGVAVGRMTCGWLCPFGFLQELIHKLSPYKLQISHKWDLLKYAFLGLGVTFLPIFWVNKFGLGERYFCEICPAGTLEAGIPQLILDPSLRGLAGWFFVFKVVLLALTLVLVFLVSRGFCRFICPLGALLGIFNGFASFRIIVDKDKCTRCDQCFKRCPVDLKVYEAEGSSACINCLECTKCGVVKYKLTLP